MDAVAVAVAAALANRRPANAPLKRMRSICRAIGLASVSSTTKPSPSAKIFATCSIQPDALVRSSAGLQSSVIATASTSSPRAAGMKISTAKTSAGPPSRSACIASAPFLAIRTSRAPSEFNMFASLCRWRQSSSKTRKERSSIRGLILSFCGRLCPEHCVTPGNFAGRGHAAIPETQRARHWSPISTQTSPGPSCVRPICAARGSRASSRSESAPRVHRLAAGRLLWQSGPSSARPGARP